MIGTSISRDMALRAALNAKIGGVEADAQFVLFRGLQEVGAQGYRYGELMASALEAAHADELAEIDRLTSELEALKEQMVSLLNRTPFPWLEPAPTAQTKERT